MEGLENTSPVNATSSTTPTPNTPAPIQQVPEVVTATPMPMPTTPAKSESITSMLKNINWLEVGFGILGAATLYYAIYYYKYNISLNKKLVVDMQNKIDEITIKVSDLESVINEEQTTTTQTTTTRNAEGKNLDIFK